MEFYPIQPLLSLHSEILDFQAILYIKNSEYTYKVNCSKHEVFITKTTNDEINPINQSTEKIQFLVDLCNVTR